MNYQRHEVFGWVVQRVSAHAGEVFELINLKDTQTDRLTAKTMHTAGLITGHRVDNPEIPALDRVPGFANDSLPNPLTKRHLKMTVQEDAVWWCVSIPANPSLPEVSYVRLQAGQSQLMPAGALIFICHGAATANDQVVNGPMSVRAQNDVLLRAGDGPVYAMIFDRENESV